MLNIKSTVSGVRDSTESQRRAHFRLRYPDPERPALVTDEGSHTVCEVSEGGLRFLSPKGSSWSCNTPIAGLLELPEHALAIEGRVLRVEGEEVIVALSEGVDLPTMVAEQKRLIRKYPAFFGRSQAADSMR